VQDDDLTHLRRSLRRSTAVAREPAQPRVIEAFPPRGAIPQRRRLTSWQITLSAVPIVAAVVSTSLLAYFMLFSERPYAPLQQERPQERGSQESQEPPQVRQEATQNAAQQRQQGSPEVQQQPSQPQQPIPTDLGPRLPMPSDAKLVILITTTLLALNQANATTNYTVLRDGAAPDFQQTNSPEHLAEIFNGLRARNLDLSPIVLHQPRLLRRPEMNEQGMIRVTGFFPTEPERVNFDLIYQPVQGKWRLLGMAVDTSPAAAQPAAAPPQARNAPSADSPQSVEAPTETSEAEKPPAPSRKPKEKPGATQEADTSSQYAKPEIEDDVRDRIENLKPKPKPEKPKDEKPKEKNTWNPFGR
jgi:hypothetical protein